MMMSLAILKPALSRTLWLLTWTGLVVYLAFTLWLGFAGLVYPYQLDYGEGIVLWFTRQIASGHSIYKGLVGFPYASSNYPPVAMLCSAILMPLFGEGYAGGRLLNFASACVVAALVYRIVSAETQQVTPGRVAASVAALVFIGSPYIYGWVPLFRVDLLGLAFSFGGLYCVWHWGRHAMPVGRGYLIGSAVLFLLALYTKQTLVAAPAAAFFAMWQRDRRTGVVFAAALGAAGGGIYLIADAITQGAFTFGIITSNATVFLPEQLGMLLANFATTFPILIALALVSVVRRVRSGRVGVLEWYAILATVVLVTAGRVGAWENYFFEVVAIGSVFAGITAAHMLDSPPRAGAWALPVLLLVQLALMWHDPRIAVNLMAADAPANRELAALLERMPEPALNGAGAVISEDMGALVTSGKEVDYYTYQYSMLARSGQWDQSWELGSLQSGAFPLVILERGTREDVDHYRRFTREFVSALDRYYAQTRTIGKYAIYTPAPALQVTPAVFGDIIETVGWSGRTDTLHPGTLTVTVVWQARRAIAQRYTAFVHLEAESAPFAKAAQDDHEPRGGLYPTTRWAAGEMVRETYTLQVPEGLPQGRYALRAGWYDTDRGDRLTVPGSSDDSAVLATYEVRR